MYTTLTTRLTGPTTRYLARASVTKCWNTTVASEVVDCSGYLEQCKENNSSLLSTVFKGTLYEYTSKKFLETKLKCYGLIRKGGAFDNGVDLVGRWDLSHFFNINQESIVKELKLINNPDDLSLILNSVELNSLLHTKSSEKSISMQQDIKILVQCKNHKAKIQATIIRELVGIYTHYIKTETQTNSTFMILISPSPLTKQAQSVIDQASIPFVHIIMTPLALKPDLSKPDVYDIQNWQGGAVQSIYLNNYSKLLLKYLNIELEFQKLKQLILV